VECTLVSLFRWQGRSLVIRVVAATLFAWIGMHPSDLRATETAPEQLSSHVVFAPACRLAVYTSNRGLYLRPFVLDLHDPSAPRERSLSIDLPADLSARSLSADCRWLALVADPEATGRYDIYLYDLREQVLTNLTKSPHRDDGTPVFAPAGSQLAYLEDRNLVLYDVDTKERQKIQGPAGPLRTLTFFEDGRSLALESIDADLWRYDPPLDSGPELFPGLSRGDWSRLWRAPAPSHSPRMLAARGGVLYFVSDHDNGFAQIYRLGPQDRAPRRVHPASHDQYSPAPQADGSLVFRMNVDGSFAAYRLSKKGALERLSPERGVVYGFESGFPRPLMLFADESRPRSLFAISVSGGLENLLPIEAPDALPEARLVRNPEGMVHLLWKPEGTMRGWVVWLHGGPHEQVSPRYNPYLASLVEQGFAVAAINYPGSTGAGNAYELRNTGADPAAASDPAAKALSGLLRDLEALRALEPGLARYSLVGVSSGAKLAQALLARERPRVETLIDFSGIADADDLALAGDGAWPPALFIRGKRDPTAQQPEHLRLIDLFVARGASRVVEIDDEGHYIRRRASVDRIRAAIRGFLEPAPPDPSHGRAPAVRPTAQLPAAP